MPSQPTIHQIIEDAWQRHAQAQTQKREDILANELISSRELEQRLQAGLNQVSLENDILEAECNRLRNAKAFDEIINQKFNNALDELLPVRTTINQCLLPHLVTPHGAIALAHLPHGHWAERENVLDSDDRPIFDSLNTSRFIELAGAMLEHLKDQIAELLGQRDGLWQAYNELKTTTTASSSPITASTASSALAAQPTSNTPDPTPSPQADQSSAANTPPPPAPASSANTLQRKRGHPKPTTTHPLPSAESAGAANPLTGNVEAGQTTTPNPTLPPSPHLPGARTFLANTDDLNRQIDLLNTGQNKWRHYPQPMRLAILAHLWQPQWRRQIEFDRTRPGWMPSAGAILFLSQHKRWSEIQQLISELRTPLSATQP